MRSSILQKSVFVLLLVFFVASGNVSIFAQSKDDEAIYQQVVKLSAEQKFTEALPLLEKIIVVYADDAEAQFYYGSALLGKAAASKDEAANKQLRIRARNAYIKSRELGNTAPIVTALISSLPEDGSSSGAFSSHLEAENAMRDAEALFAQGKLDDALATYQKALKLDPTIYEAALFSGDVYMNKGDYGQAEIWYQKAIAIDPNRETAYRYSATPLMKQKKYEQARDRYIEAFISEPYNRFSPAGISQWAQVTGAQLGHPKIDIPANVGKGSNGNLQISVGDGGDDDGSFAWTTYGMMRAVWQLGDGLSDKFKKAYPAEKTYRHSLAEEAEALRITASTLKSRMAEKNSPVKKLNPQLATLIKLYDEGLIEAYVLMAMPDQGIAQDHPAYLKQNREKLKLYVAKYVIHQ